MLRALLVDGRLLGTVHALGVSRPSADSTVLLIDSLVSLFGVMETYTLPVLIIPRLALRWLLKTCFRGLFKFCGYCQDTLFYVQRSDGFSPQVDTFELSSI